VIVQGCPGDTQPGGVEPDPVNHRLVLSGPEGEVMPGLNMLPLSVAPPSELDWFPSTCSTVTSIGVHLTLGFQETNPAAGLLAAIAGEAVPE